MAAASPEPLIDPTFLFEFEIPVEHTDSAWDRRGVKLADKHQLPHLGSLGGGPSYADVRAAWSDAGLFFWMSIDGKRQLPWCRDTRMDESDGLHVWIDTRCSPDVHRATQHCHRFLFLPTGGGPRREVPVADWVAINRARQNPKPVAKEHLAVASTMRHDGYELSGHVAAAALTGYDPRDQRRVKLFYQVADREMGTQSLSLGEPFPVAEDPSTWPQAVLV